jgi:hypothetical protein
MQVCRCAGVQYSREYIIFILFLPEIGYVEQHLPKVAKSFDGFLYVKENVIINETYPVKPS